MIFSLFSLCVRLELFMYLDYLCLSVTMDIFQKKQRNSMGMHRYNAKQTTMYHSWANISLHLYQHEPPLWRFLCASIPIVWMYIEKRWSMCYYILMHIHMQDAFCGYLIHCYSDFSSWRGGWSETSLIPQLWWNIIQKSRTSRIELCMSIKRTILSL